MNKRVCLFPHLCFYCQLWIYAYGICTSHFSRKIFDCATLIVFNFKLDLDADLWPEVMVMIFFKFLFWRLIRYLFKKIIINLGDLRGFPSGLVDKESACNARDPVFDSWIGKIFGEGNDNPLQFCAWGIPWTEEPGRLQFLQRQKSETT